MFLRYNLKVSVNLKVHDGSVVMKNLINRASAKTITFYKDR